MKKSYKNVRKRLFNKNPYCPRCGVRMILPENLELENGKIKYFPTNTCSYEHRYTKIDKEKRRNNKGMGSILCKQCNELAGAERQSQLSIDELHNRSQHRH